MQSKSIKGKSPQEIRIALIESMADGFKPTLAIVFLSVKQEIDTITNLFDENCIRIFGATTAGEFIDGDIEAGSIAVLLLDMHPNYFNIVILETSQDTAFDDAVKLGFAGRESFAHPAFVIANSGVSLDGEPFVEGITNVFENEVTIFGGKAADDLALEATYVFTNDKKHDSAIVALIIDEDKIDVKGIATCGWKAVGTTKTVTKSEGNIVYTIDDKPALDTLMNFLGVEIKQEDNKEIVTFFKLLVLSVTGGKRKC